MRKWCFIFVLIIGLAACSDDKDVLAPVPNDVTLNELSLQRKMVTERMLGLLIPTGIIVLLRGRPRKKRWIPIFIVFIPVSRMRMKFMPWEEWKEMMLILPWNLRRW